MDHSLNSEEDNWTWQTMSCLYDPIRSIMLLVFNAKQGCFLVTSINPKKASKRKQGHKTKALKGAFPTMSLLSLTAQPLQLIPCNVR